MSVDWLRFHPDLESHVLHIEILTGTLLDNQPDTREEIDTYCETLYPQLDAIRDICLTHNLKQHCTVDMEGIDLIRVKPLSLMRIIWNVYDHTKDHFLLSGCDITHSNSIFGALYEGLKGCLPPILRNFIHVS